MKSLVWRPSVTPIAALFAERQIVALADIVEAEQLHHDVMHGVLAGLDEGEAVVARIEVQEPRDERMIVIIGQPEAERAAIERHQLVDGFRGVDIEHDMAQAERSGAKTRDRASGPERLRRGFGAVEQLQPVAERIVEHDQIFDVAFVGQRAGAARHLDLVPLQMRRDGIERRGIGDFPAEKADALAAVGS